MSSKIVFVCDHCNAEHAQPQVTFDGGLHVLIHREFKFQRDQFDFCSINGLVGFFTKQVQGK